MDERRHREEAGTLGLGALVALVAASRTWASSGVQASPHPCCTMGEYLHGAGRRRSDTAGNGGSSARARLAPARLYPTRDQPVQPLLSLRHSPSPAVEPVHCPCVLRFGCRLLTAERGTGRQDTRTRGYTKAACNTIQLDEDVLKEDVRRHCSLCRCRLAADKGCLAARVVCRGGFCLLALYRACVDVCMRCVAPRSRLSRLEHRTGCQDDSCVRRVEGMSPCLCSRRMCAGGGGFGQLIPRSFGIDRDHGCSCPTTSCCEHCMGHTSWHLGVVAFGVVVVPVLRLERLGGSMSICRGGVPRLGSLEGLRFLPALTSLLVRREWPFGVPKLKRPSPMIPDPISDTLSPIPSRALSFWLSCSSTLTRVAHISVIDS